MLNLKVDNTKVLFVFESAYDLYINFILYN